MQKSGLGMMLKALGLPDISQLAPVLEKFQSDLAQAAEFVKSKFSALETRLDIIEAHNAGRAEMAAERYRAMMRCIESQNKILSDQVVGLAQQVSALTTYLAQKEVENGNNTKPASGSNRDRTGIAGGGSHGRR